MQSGWLGRAISASGQFLTRCRASPHLRRTISFFPPVRTGEKHPLQAPKVITGCSQSYMVELETIAKSLKDKATTIQPSEASHEQLGYFPGDADPPTGQPATSIQPSETSHEQLGYFPFEGNANPPTGSHQVLEDQVERVETPEGRFYHIRSSDKMTVYSLPSVTTVLDNTRSKKSYFSLRNWRKNMIKEHGEEGYRRIKKETIGQGANFHQQLEIRLRNRSHLKPVTPTVPEEPPAVESTSEELFSKTVAEETKPPPPAVESTSEALFSKTVAEETKPPPPAVESTSEELFSEATRSPGLFQSVEHVLKDISEVHALESVVTHLKLGYTGTCDCIAMFKDQLCVIDWKTSSRPRPSLSDCYDFPLQAAAYAGAVNQDHRYPFKVYCALIVVAYPTGEPAHAHFLSQEQCHEQWLKWLERLEEYHTQFAHDLSNVYI